MDGFTPFPNLQIRPGPDETRSADCAVRPARIRRRHPKLIFASRFVLESALVSASSSEMRWSV